MARFLDIGTLDIKNRLRLSDTFLSFSTRFEPMRSWVGPLWECGKKSRLVPDSVFDTALCPYRSSTLDGERLKTSLFLLHLLIGAMQKGH